MRTSRQWGRYYCGDNEAPYGPFTVPRHRDYADGARWLYFMQSGELLKIGISSDPVQRYNGFRLANPAIRLAGALKAPRVLAHQVERLVHQRFAEYAHGREWFTIDFRTAQREARAIIRDAEKAVCRMRLWGDLKTFDERDGDRRELELTPERAAAFHSLPSPSS